MAKTEKTPRTPRNFWERSLHAERVQRALVSMGADTAAFESAYGQARKPRKKIADLEAELAAARAELAAAKSKSRKAA